MKISIIGAAGTVGSCAAFEIAVQGLADELVMLDINQNLLIQQVNDLSDAITGVQDMALRAGNDADLAGSNIVIMAAGTTPRPNTNRMEYLRDNLPIIKDIAQKIARLCPDAVVITATNPIDPLNYAMCRCSGLDRKKLLGYSLNDSIRFRMWIARALGVKSTQVGGIVIGEHGNSQVMLFSSIRVDGKPIAVSEEFKHAMRQKIPDFLKTWASLRVTRTAGWTSAVGLATMVKAIAKDTEEVIPCSVALDGEYGRHGLSIGVPAVLGRGGVRQVLEWELAPDEKQELEYSIAVLKEAACLVDEVL